MTSLPNDKELVVAEALASLIRDTHSSYSAYDFRMLDEPCRVYIHVYNNMDCWSAYTTDALMLGPVSPSLEEAVSKLYDIILLQRSNT